MSDKKHISLFPAATLTQESQERVDIIRHKLKFVEIKPTVACIEELSPLMVVGNWTAELVAIAGGKPILVENGKHSLFINFQAIKSEDPDIIVIKPFGFSIPRTLKEVHLLAELSGWKELSAVKNNQVYIADGSQYFNHLGPRLVDSVEMLAEIIHPKQFIFGYEGGGWIKFIS